MTHFNKLTAAELRDTIRRTQLQQQRALKEAVAHRRALDNGGTTAAVRSYRIYTKILKSLESELDSRGAAMVPAGQVQDWPQYRAPVLNSTGV